MLEGLRRYGLPALSRMNAADDIADRLAPIGHRRRRRPPFVRERVAKPDKREEDPGKPLMLEITGDDIALLNDTDLRTLVGRLCEAELRRHRISTATVTYGGDQNATDGGLDVRVSLPTGSDRHDFIPRPHTGYQVKRSDMPRAKIRAEMRPKGKLRRVIGELAAHEGAYIIVSSKGATSDIALNNRRAAMRQAAGRNASGLMVDFYDRTRISTWLRDHPGLFPWVRERVGKTMTGWQSYGAWAYDPLGATGEYLLDEALRVKIGTIEGATGRIALEGLHDLRNALRGPRSMIRLVGLSGVGKTRFVQALFDTRIGTDSLDPSKVLYANLADGPSPSPLTVAADLLALRVPAILVIDNCGAQLHERLAERCRAPESLLSIITIEYDVRDDEPDGTLVVKLEPSSDDLVEKLLKRRFPQLSPMDARTVAAFSGGNARVGLALADTIGPHESIAQLTNAELFQRLFRQRHEHDEPLYLAGQACALVYSFQTEDVGPESEFARLGSLVGLSAQRMYQCVAELQRRDLAQRRSVWRAVLPQAIANRLAATALQNIPRVFIKNRLVDGAPERLRLSFAHRLGYLHTSTEAQEIVGEWLSPTGFLGNVAELTEADRAVFEHIAPVAPAATLGAIVRALQDADNVTVRRCAPYLHLLHSLAWDPALFEPAVSLIIRLLLAEEDDPGRKGEQDVFVSLFSLYLSGTRATLEQRLQVVESLLRSNDPKRQALGTSALRASLEALHFFSALSFDFGGHTRDFGYWPHTFAEVQSWYRSALHLATTIACSDAHSALKTRSALADAFRGLWLRAGIHEELECACSAISQAGFWPEGWLAVRQAIHFDAAALPCDVGKRLANLDVKLGPTNVVDRVRAIVLPKGAMHLAADAIPDELEDDPMRRHIRVQELARTLGTAVAADANAFEELLPELVINDGLLWPFGMGLTDGSPDRKACWDQLVDQFSQAPAEHRCVEILRGYVHGLRASDPVLADTILDEAMANDVLAPWYPVLQAVVTIDDAAVRRLLRSLGHAKAHAWAYRALAAGGATYPLRPQDLYDVLIGIAGLPDGGDAALEILQMRLHAYKNEALPPEVVAAGRALLQMVPFKGRNAHDDYRLGIISKSCLKGPDGADATYALCLRFKGAIRTRQTHPSYHADFVCSMIASQRRAALDGLCGGGPKELAAGLSILESIREFRQNPTDRIPEEVLLSWCDQEPAERYPAIARVIRIATRKADAAPMEWTPVARHLLDRAPDRVAVLEQYVRQFGHIWAGAKLDDIESRVRMLDEYRTHEDPGVAAFATSEGARLGAAIATARRQEAASARERDERFE
jgi:hypothetical protein